MNISNISLHIDYIRLHLFSQFLHDGFDKHLEGL